MHFLGMIWNPSEGIDLGIINVRFYSLMFVVAFGLGWYVMKYIYQREGESLENLDKLFLYTVLATLIGARLGHVFFYDWDYFKDHLLEILLPIKETAEGWKFTGFAGLASHGAAIAIIIIMWYYSKKIIQKPIFWILDRIVIPVSLGAIFVRLGNFFNSEIIGKTTSESSFLATKFIRGEENLNSYEVTKLTQIADANQAYNAIETNPIFIETLNAIPFRYPAQLYEAIGYVFVFAILFYLYWKTDARNKQGFLFGVFLVLLWTVRFLVEYVKESQGGFENALGIFSTGQWLSIPFIIAGIYFILKAKKVT
jgi:prolipoprotein diacylglyceryl transferase